MEEAPGDCHRNRDICAPHVPEAVHIFRDELIVQAALDAGPDADYEVAGSLRDLLTGSPRLI
jgi:hypothetical protein